MSEPRGVVGLFSRLGVSLSPPKVIVLYGEPMVGKSVLSVMLAGRLASSMNRRVGLIYTEPVWEDPEYQSFVVNATNAKFDLVRLADWRHFNSIVAGFRDRVIVFDSISALITDIVSRFTMSGWDLRAVTPRVHQIVVTLVHYLRAVVNSSKTVAVIVAHASSTAGTGRYRGVTDSRPSFTRRVLHECDVELELRIDPENKDVRVLTVVANRINPFSDGKSVYFRFIKGDVEEVPEEGLKVKVV